MIGLWDASTRRGTGCRSLIAMLLCTLPLGAQAMQRKVPAPVAAPTQVVAAPPPTRAPTPPQLPPAQAPPPSMAGLNSGVITTTVVAEPAAIAFGSVFSGDSRQAKVKVVAPRDGKVAVSLDARAPFRIAEVQVFGMPVAPSMRPVPNQLPGQTTGSQMMAGRTSGNSPALNTNASKSLLATFTSAPFAIPIREGNELVVTLVFAPKLDLVNGPPVGNHQATLAVDGGLWKVPVPISGRFEGLKIGIVAVLSNPDVVVFSGKLGALSGAELVLTNAEKQPVVARIAAKTLPPGFALAQLDIQVPGGQTRTIPLPVTVSPTMHEGAQQSAELTVTTSGKVKAVPFTFSVYPPFKQFRFEGEDSVKWTFWIAIEPSGKTKFGMYAMNPNYVFTRLVDFHVKWKGAHMYTATTSLGKRNFDDYLQTKNWTLSMIPLVRDHYVEMLSVPLTVEMTYENGSK